MSKIFDQFKVCRVPGLCAICGGPNGCRMESGEGFKGACWCERLTLSTATLERLESELSEPRCLCRGCLMAVEASGDLSWMELVRERRAMTERPPAL